MSSSTTIIDMNTAIGRGIYRGRGKEIVNKFNSTYKEILQQLLSDLNSNKSALETLYKEIAIALNKAYLTDVGIGQKYKSEDIISRIYEVIGKIDKGEQIKNLAEALKNTGLNEKYITDEALDKINQFINKYVDTRDLLLQAQRTVAEDSSVIRGDTYHYGLLLQNATNNNNNQKISKLILLTEKQFYDFEEQNKDLFQLSTSRRSKVTDKVTKKEWYTGTEGAVKDYGLRLGTTAETVYNRIVETFGEEANKDILDSVFAYNSQTKQAISTRNMYNILFDTYASTYGGGRTLEMLFDKSLRKWTQKEMQKGTFNKENLVEYLKSTQFDAGRYSKARAENVYAYATGDVNFKVGKDIMGKDIIQAWQLKFKGSSSPWHGTTYAGIQDSLTSLISLCDKVESDPKMIQNIGNQFASEEDAVKYMESNPRALKSLQEMGAQDIYKDFLSFDWKTNDNPTGTYTEVWFE